MRTCSRTRIHQFCSGVAELGDFPGGSDSKASVYNAGGLGSIPGSGRFPEEGNRKSHGQRSLVSMGSQRVGHNWAISLWLWDIREKKNVLLSFFHLLSWRKLTRPLMQSVSPFSRRSTAASPPLLADSPFLGMRLCSLSSAVLQDAPRRALQDCPVGWKSP